MIRPEFCDTIKRSIPPAILGMNHLAKLRLYFSFKEQMLYVTPANANWVGAIAA
ncbi:MAG: hypothetical protein JWM91_223 [Rhodospirillales bacterium]|nr:hypothetical protein [Rhodospirillales bacterium]